MYTCLDIAKPHGGHVIKIVCEVKSRTEVNQLGTKEKWGYRGDRGEHAWRSLWSRKRHPRWEVQGGDLIDTLA